jgi:chemotaxis receptor (MCP) glutamine deamidase CheD
MGKVSVSIGGIGHSDKWDPIETSGLGDCICLVAYDKNKKVGSMYHFITTPCRSGPAENIKIDQKPLKAAKAKLDKAFKGIHSKGTKITNYYVKLGKEWTANSMLKGGPNKALSAACKSVFSVNPSGSGAKATFHPGTGKLT